MLLRWSVIALSLVLVLCGAADSAGHDVVRKLHEAVPARAEYVGILIDARAAASSTVSRDIFGTNLTASMDLTNGTNAYPTMMNAFGKAHFGMVRWPLALLSDYYHWRQNTFSSCAVNAWGNQGLQSLTTFDEFMQQVALPLGLDVDITVNYGTNADCTNGGSPQEAAEWVDYANNRMHYGIKYWSIGNEQYFASASRRLPASCCETPAFHVAPNAPGLVYSRRYAALIAKQFYPLMKAKDPNIQIGVDLVVPNNGVSSIAQPWDATVLRDADYDFVEVHWYGAPDTLVPLTDSQLLTQGAAYFKSALAQLRSELRAAGRAKTPIYIGEWGVPGAEGGSPQDVSVVGALYTALALGNMIQGGVAMATSWQGWLSPCDATYPGFYTWQSWFTSSLFEADEYAVECPYGPLPALGTALPRENAVRVVQQALQPGDAVFDPALSAPSSVTAFAARRANGYGLLLVNVDETNDVNAAIAISGDARTFAASSLEYGKAQYDESQRNLWAGPVFRSLGPTKGTFVVTLRPWSVTALTLSAR